jgi:tetratricopeptide (TPR) repeat protein
MGPLVISTLKRRRSSSRTVAALFAVVALTAACAGNGSNNGDNGAGGAGVDAAITPAAGNGDLPAATSALGSYLATRHARRNHDSAAIAHYVARVLADDPANPELLAQALIASLSERDMAGAVDYALRLQKVDEETRIAGIALAVDAIARGDAAVALGHLRGAPMSGLNKYLIPLLTAWTLVGSDDGDPMAALAELGKTSAFASTHDFHTGLIGEIVGDKLETENGYAGALSALRGGSLRVVLAAAGFFQRSGRTDEARAIYDSYVEQNPDTTFLDEAYGALVAGEPPELLVANSAEGYAEVFYGIAASLFQENAVEAALAYTQMALYLRPDMDASLMMLGDIMASTERYEEAVEAYTSPTDSDALTWNLRLRAAGALAELERIDAAAEHLRRMALERPERADPLITLGDMMRSRSRWQDAVEAYDLALARIPTLDQRHWTLLYARGIALERSKQWPRAEADFLQALELEPDQPLVLNYLGYSWVEKGLYLDRARAMIESAVEQRPNDGYIVDSLGWVLYQLGDFAGAAEHLERAAELRPSDPVIIDHYADGLWRVGRREEARFQWRRALSFEPESDVADRLRDKIANGLDPLPLAGDRPEDL